MSRLPSGSWISLRFLPDGIGGHKIRILAVITRRHKSMTHKILIVDDNEYIRRGIRSSIETRTDWVVVGEAENGKHAVTLVATHKPHMVILDLSMPVMNGLDAAREISRISPGMPMILFTLHNQDGLLEMAHSAGIKHVFSKSDGMDDQVFSAITEMLAA